MDLPKHEPHPLEGLSARLDKLQYRYAQEEALAERPHLFTYFITIANRSDRRITLIGRKWVLRSDGGSTEVVEGDSIVGKRPVIWPGETFSYNSFHTTACPTEANGTFFGLDDGDNLVRVSLPPFHLTLPNSIS